MGSEEENSTCLGDIVRGEEELSGEPNDQQEQISNRRPKTLVECISFTQLGVAITWSRVQRP